MNEQMDDLKRAQADLYMARLGYCYHNFGNQQHTLAKRLYRIRTQIERSETTSLVPDSIWRDVLVKTHDIAQNRNSA